MNEPYLIKRRIILDRDKINVSSEGYIINRISDFMKQFEMMEKRIHGNDLYYYNVDLLKSFERKRQIQNISFTVEISESQIIITLGTSIIYPFVIFILSIFLPFIFLPFTAAIIIPIGGAALFFLSYLVRLHVLLYFKEEFENMVNELR